MSDRVLRARNEPENPVETAVTGVERIGPEEAVGAFNPYGGMMARLKDNKYKDLLQAAIESGEWVGIRYTYRTFIPFQWREDHYTGSHGTESPRHELYKIVAAEFLDRCGHELQRMKNHRYEGISEYNREWLYDSDLFEVYYEPGIADLACRCDDHTVYGEVGYTTAEKWATIARSDMHPLLVVPYKGCDLGRRGIEVDIYYFYHNERSEIDLSGYVSKTCKECSSRKVEAIEETDRMALYECEDCRHWWYEDK